MLKGLSINKIIYSSVPYSSRRTQSASKSKEKQYLVRNRKLEMNSKIVLPSSKKFNASGGYF